MPKLVLGEVCKRKGVSKRELAKRLGIRYHNVFRLFHDDANPRLSQVFRYAAALKCKVRDLIKE